MNEIAQQALAAVNAARERQGQPKLLRLKRGRRMTSCACPIARSWPGCITVTAHMITLRESDPALGKNLLGELSTPFDYYGYRPPVAVQRFIRDFDAGLLPEYEGEEG